MCVPRVVRGGGEMKKYQTDIFKKFYIDVYDLWFCLWDYAIKIVMNDNAMSYYSRGFCGYQSFLKPMGELLFFGDGKNLVYCFRRSKKCISQGRRRY